MSALKAFLQPTVVGKTKEVIISERFKGEDGEPVPLSSRRSARNGMRSCPGFQGRNR